MKTSTTSPDSQMALLSRIIDNMRLPLAIGIVLIHSYPIAVVDSNEPSAYVYDLFRYLLCQGFTRVCVPLFFVISGFLLFKNLTDYSRQDYFKKVKSRTSSLLVPYLFWGALMFLLISAKFLFHEVNLVSLLKLAMYAFVGDIWNPTSNYFEPYCYPLDYPLWFIRDLYVFVLFSPVFFFLIKRFGVWFIALLTLCFLSFLWPTVIFFSASGVLMFSLGAWLAIKRHNPVEFVIGRSRLSKSMILIYLLLVVADTVTFVNAMSVWRYVHAIEILTGTYAMFAFFCFIAVRKPDWKSKVSGSYVFALYCMQAIVNVYINRLPYPDSSTILGNSLRLAASFIGMIVGSTIIYCAITKFCPALARIMFRKKRTPDALEKR